jgi:hypothetical protein
MQRAELNVRRRVTTSSPQKSRADNRAVVTSRLRDSTRVDRGVGSGPGALVRRRFPVISGVRAHFRAPQ